MKVYLDNLSPVLKKTDLCESFNITTNQEERNYIVIPSEYYNKTVYNNDFTFENYTIKNINELSQFLSIIRFWNIVKVPFCIYEFIDKNPSLDYNCIWIKHDRAFTTPIIDELQIIHHHNIEANITNKPTLKKLLNATIKGGYIRLIEFLDHKYGKKLKWSHAFCKHIAKNNSLEMMKYLCEKHGLMIHVSSIIQLMHHCDLEIITYIIENNKLACSKNYIRSYSVNYNRLDIVKYLISKNISSYVDIVILSLERSKFDILKYALRNINDKTVLKHHPPSGFSVHVLGGTCDLELIKLLEKYHMNMNNARFVERLYYHNNLECLQYLHTKKKIKITSPNNILVNLQNINIETTKYFHYVGGIIDVERENIEDLTYHNRKDLIMFINEKYPKNKKKFIKYVDKMHTPKFACFNNDAENYLLEISKKNKGGKEGKKVNKKGKCIIC